MKTIRLRTVALACSSLFATPFLSFAQIKSDIATTNMAEAPLERAIARALSVYVEDNLAFFTDQTQGNPQQQKPPPVPNPAAPSLGDLGFPPAQTQGNPQDQARLDKRSHMLKIHQRLGLITTAPLLATVISGSFAGGRSTSSSARDLHVALGSVTGVLYFTTAYYAIFAPKISGTTARGPIRLHRALAWIHGPGMILTPVLGAMAFEQKSEGEKVHGIASAHGAVGYVTAAAFGLAIISVSFKF